MAHSVFRDTYTRGRLALAGMGPWTPLRDYLDACYVIILETDVELIKKLEQELSAIDAQIDPDEVRKTWGATPEHQALGAGLTRQ